jgi:aryl-alcohol dehydrogenase-like predicted oxidoreductase
VGLAAAPGVTGVATFPPGVASAIVGAETAEEVTANATAADVSLDQAQLDALTALPAHKDN